MEDDYPLKNADYPLKEEELSVGDVRALLACDPVYELTALDEWVAQGLPAYRDKGKVGPVDAPVFSSAAAKEQDKFWINREELKTFLRDNGLDLPSFWFEVDHEEAMIALLLAQGVELPGFDFKVALNRFLLGKWRNDPSFFQLGAEHEEDLKAFLQAQDVQLPGFDFREALKHFLLDRGLDLPPFWFQAEHETALKAFLVAQGVEMPGFDLKKALNKFMRDRFFRNDLSFLQLGAEHEEGLKAFLQAQDVQLPDFDFIKAMKQYLLDRGLDLPPFWFQIEHETTLRAFLVAQGVELPGLDLWAALAKLLEERGVDPKNFNSKKGMLKALLLAQGVDLPISWGEGTPGTTAFAHARAKQLRPGRALVAKKLRLTRELAEWKALAPETLKDKQEKNRRVELLEVEIKVIKEAINRPQDGGLPASPDGLSKVMARAWRAANMRRAGKSNAEIAEVLHLNAHTHDSQMRAVRYALSKAKKTWGIKAVEPDS